METEILERIAHHAQTRYPPWCLGISIHTPAQHTHSQLFVLSSCTEIHAVAYRQLSYICFDRILLGMWIEIQKDPPTAGGRICACRRMSWMAMNRTGKFSNPHTTNTWPRRGWLSGGSGELMRRMRTYGQLDEGYNWPTNADRRTIVTVTDDVHSTTLPRAASEDWVIARW